jgi:peptide/nickel transport system permease protein
MSVSTRQRPAAAELAVSLPPRPESLRGAPRPLSALRAPGLPTLVLAIAVVVTVLAFAVVPGLVAPYDPTAALPAARLQPPSAAHLFGTDQLGRDLFSRVVYGAARTLFATVLAVGIGVVFGSVIGLVSGFVGGRLDEVVMRFVDVALAIPGLLLAMAVIAALGFGITNVAIAVGVASIASFARLMRSDVLRVRSSAYVEAAYAGGDRTWWVVVRHVLPNAWGPVAALVAVEVGSAVLAVAALSFLGYGVVPPDPEWGSLISEGRAYLATSWWLTTLPGLVLIAVVLSANRIGQAIQRRDGARR